MTKIRLDCDYGHFSWHAFPITLYHNFNDAIMETTLKTNHAKNFTTVNRSTKNVVSPVWEKIEFSRFGIISMLVVILGCSGGLAASFGAQDDALKLAMIVFPTILSLALILAVAPMRAIIYLSTLAVILDLIVLLFL